MDSKERRPKQLPHTNLPPPHALLLRNAIDDGSARCPALARTRAAPEALDRRLKPSKLWLPDKGADRARARYIALSFVPTAWPAGRESQR